jgi:catechol 2,3-dioxygenase-like lactoylglutathione lyase family enzyme
VGSDTLGPALAKAPRSAFTNIGPGTGVGEYVPDYQQRSATNYFLRKSLTNKASRDKRGLRRISHGSGVLAIFSADAQEKYIPNSAVPAMNKSAILQFRVNDPDQEFARLQGMVKTWVKPPTTQPWGTRSIYFRDPDGNLVDFFTPPKKP